MTITAQYGLSAQDLVRREVIHCVSSLVHTLASAYGSTDFQDDIRSSAGRDMMLLTEQAFELASPVPDYEEAAREAGWVETEDGALAHPDGCEGSTWGSVCEHYGIEPYEREVFEHWIVSDWLADKLIEKGEKVDKDFQGLCVWARTTTGQAIAMDWVIEEITRELNAA